MWSFENQVQAIQIDYITLDELIMGRVINARSELQKNREEVKKYLSEIKEKKEFISYIYQHKECFEKYEFILANEELKIAKENWKKAADKVSSSKSYLNSMMRFYENVKKSISKEYLKSNLAKFNSK